MQPLQLGGLARSAPRVPGNLALYSQRLQTRKRQRGDSPAIFDGCSVRWQRFGRRPPFCPQPTRSTSVVAQSLPGCGGRASHSRVNTGWEENIQHWSRSGDGAIPGHIKAAKRLLCPLATVAHGVLRGVERGRWSVGEEVGAFSEPRTVACSGERPFANDRRGGSPGGARRPPIARQLKTASFTNRKERKELSLAGVDIPTRKRERNSPATNKQTNKHRTNWRGKKIDHSPFSKLRFLQTSSSAIKLWTSCPRELPPCALDDVLFISWFAALPVKTCPPASFLRSASRWCASW